MSGGQIVGGVVGAVAGYFMPGGGVGRVKGLSCSTRSIGTIAPWFVRVFIVCGAPKFRFACSCFYKPARISQRLFLLCSPDLCAFACQSGRLGLVAGMAKRLGGYESAKEHGIHLL